MLKDYLYYKNIFSCTSMPFVAVDMELFNGNINQVIHRASPKKIRIASKSIRCVNLIKHILQSNPSYQGVMCYSAEEAVHLYDHKINDLLIAYPIFQKQKLQVICETVQKGADIVLMVDCSSHVQKISEIAVQNDVTISLCIDVDMSSSFPALYFGVRRSPLSCASKIVKLAKEIEQTPNLSFSGIMGYEAQIAGLGDRNPYNNFLLNSIIRFLQKKSIQTVKRRRESVVAALHDAGLPCKIVNGGGTGSLETTALESCVTEVTAGSAFFSPGLFDHYSKFQHLPAMFYAIEITRIPIPEIFTCHGGGYVASGTGKDKIPQPYLPKGSSLLDTEGAGEVQTPIVYKGKEKLHLGAPIFMRHSKAGELCEHFNYIHLIENGEIIDRVATYRGEGKRFL